MAVKSQGRIVLLDLQAVGVVRAQGNSVVLQQETDSHFLRESISVLAEKLRPYGFIRIHRSVLVNGAYVDEIRSRPSGEYGIRVGARQYTVTRTYKQELNHLAELWIGVDRFSSKP
jgi:DNA-binding LytR/AlgR family response regulator